MSDNVERNIVDLIFDENVDDNIYENVNYDIGNVNQTSFDEMLTYESEDYENEDLDLDKEFAEQEKEESDVQEVADDHQETSSDHEQTPKNGQPFYDGANDTDPSVNDTSDNNTDTQSNAATSGAYFNQYQGMKYLVGPNGKGFYVPPGTFMTPEEEEDFIRRGNLIRVDPNSAPVNQFSDSTLSSAQDNPGVQYRQGQNAIFPNETQPNQTDTPSFGETGIQPDIPLPVDNSSIETANQLLEFLNPGGSANDANLNNASSNIINSATDPQSGMANSQLNMASQPNVLFSESAGNEHAGGDVSDQVDENEEDGADDENYDEFEGQVEREQTETAPERPPTPEPRQPVEHILDPVTHGVNMNTRFSSLQEARAWRMYTFRKPEDDPTIPTTEEQMKAIVVELSNAMKAIGHCTDNAVFRNRYRAHLQAERVEVAAWETLDLLIQRCRNGPLAQTDENARIDKKRSRQLPFTERLEKVLDALYKRKTICKRLMDIPQGYNLVDYPVREKNRSESNQKLNGRKAGYVQVGKEVLQAQEARNNNAGSGNAQNRAGRGRGRGRGNARAAATNNAARGRRDARPAPINDQNAKNVQNIQHAHNAHNAQGRLLPAPLNPTLGGHAVPAPPSSPPLQPQQGAPATATTAPTKATPLSRGPASTRGGRRAGTTRQRASAANGTQNHLPGPFSPAQRASLYAMAPQSPALVPWGLQTPRVNPLTNGYVPLPTQQQNQNYGMQRHHAMPPYSQKNAGHAQRGFLMTNAANYLGYAGGDTFSIPTDENDPTPAEAPPQPVAQPMQRNYSTPNEVPRQPVAQAMQQNYPQVSMNQNQMPGAVYGQQANQFVPQTPRRNRQMNMSQNAMAGQIQWNPQFNPSASPNPNRRMSGQATQYNPQANMNQNQMVYDQQTIQQQNQSVRQNQTSVMSAQAFQPQVNQIHNHPMTGPTPRLQPASRSGNGTGRKRSQAEMGSTDDGMMPPPPKRAHR